MFVYIVLNGLIDIAFSFFLLYDVSSKQIKGFFLWFLTLTH